jgi:hypothetical protein
MFLLEQRNWVMKRTLLSSRAHWLVQPQTVQQARHPRNAFQERNPMSTKTILIAAVSALITTFGVSAASAHKMGGGGMSMHMGSSMHHDDHHFYHSRVLLVSPGNGCGYYYDKWMLTGSHYWKREYYVCKGWW